ETIIINQLAQINPGKIAITDLNYIARDNPFLTGRFDALELDFNNKVTKIIEIKTTNTPQTFFPHPSDTIQKTKRVLENIPLDYTHQLLYYMKMANVLEGQIVALTNIFDLTKKDNAYNIAKFDIDNKNTISKLGRVRFSQPKKIIDLYATCYYPKLYEFTCFLKSNLSKKVSHIPSGRFSPKNSEAKVEDLKLELNDIFRSGKINKIVAIDIETDRDRIIEFGAIVSDLSGNILCEVGQLVDGKNESSLFGVPEFWPFINYGELEYEGLHNITPVLIANKPLFEYSDKLKEIVNLLFQPNQILLYHNASMENGKFSLWIPDYFVRLKKGTIRVVDSLNYSKYLDNVKKDEIKNSQTNSIVDIYQNDTLDSYAKRWGVKPNSETGDELHRGHDDARIMLEVFLKHSGEILKDI
ncbi:MAG: hypothetical protein LBT99_00365, partial [Bifidobacteriaceae bacterium]|nr:hypothetical protein [Bifidobacteriaceae bacterium]